MTQFEMRALQPYSVEFSIPGLPKMANQLLRGHWRTKHAHTKRWKAAVADVMRFKIKPAQPLTSAALILIRVSSSQPDFDGLVSGFKPIIDALVECGVLESDKPSCLKDPKFVWERGSRGHGKIKVKVMETLP